MLMYIHGSDCDFQIMPPAGEWGHLFERETQPFRVGLFWPARCGASMRRVEEFNAPDSQRSCRSEGTVPARGLGTV